MDEYNYGTPDLNSAVTKHPYVRCNSGIPVVPKDHHITVVGELVSIGTLLAFAIVLAIPRASEIAPPKRGKEFVAVVSAVPMTEVGIAICLLAFRML